MLPSKLCQLALYKWQAYMQASQPSSALPLTLRAGTGQCPSNMSRQARRRCKLTVVVDPAVSVVVCMQVCVQPVAAPPRQC